MQTAFLEKIRIATRQSKLALWQANHVAERLRAHHPELTVELVPMTTKGDQILDSPLAKIGGKGLFIKELEVAMARGEADIAVHSMKDVGVEFPEGFVLAAILARENPYDALVSSRFRQFSELPQSAIVGTCSLRRRMQIARLRPDIELRDLRGNVQTRLGKLDDGDFDAIILACAGLKRLNLKHRITQILPESDFLPAIGQGAIGIECHQDSPARTYLNALNDPDTALCVHSERIINQRLQGSCQVPIAAFAQLHDNTLHLEARIAFPDGTHFCQFRGEAERTQADALGHNAAQSLIDQGALDILDALRHA